MNRRSQCIPALEGVPEDLASVDELRRALPAVEDVERVAGVFRLMGEPGRVRILATLLEAGEVCVHDLATISGQSESSVSQALRLMRAQRVVQTRRSGREVFYRLSDGHVRMLLDMAITHVGHSPAITPISSENEIPAHRNNKESS